MGLYSGISTKAIFFKLSLDLNKVSLKNKKGLQDLWEIWKPAKENGNPFSKVGTDNKGIFSKIINLEAVPETWLINPKGKIVLRLKGNLQEFSGDEIKRYIRLN